MSRSFKRHPYCGDNKGKAKKRVANKAVRNKQKSFDVALKGGQFKKLYESWNICDYYWSETWEDYWNFQIKLWEQFDRLKGKPFPNKKEAYRDWKRMYKNK